MDTINSSTVSVIPSSYIICDTNVSYSINFVIGNEIGQSGYVRLTIPSSITLNIGSIASNC